MSLHSDNDLRRAVAAAVGRDEDSEVLSDGMLPTIRELLASLDGKGVRYCHWKSNIRLAECLAGIGDLDLLVDRQDAAAFQAALAENGFKLTVWRHGMGHPGVFHAFVLDPHRSELVHVHAYFDIVTGDSLVKNYRLPIESMLLQGTHRLHGVPVPTPETELVMFVLRVALKHTSPLEAWLANRDYASISQELAWLRGRADQIAAEALWSSWIPGAGQRMFRELLEAISDHGAVMRRLRLGLKVARLLRGYRRLGTAAMAILQLRHAALLGMRRFRRRRELALQTGGAIIAVVGPKATGKSTLSTAAADRLGGHLDVWQVHVGKPPATALTVLPACLVPLARRLFPKERSGEYEAPERRADGRYSLLYIVRMTLLAHDRRALLRRMWRAAANGSIVIADRFPSMTIGAADSSRFDDDTIRNCRSRVKRWLMRRERAFYESLPQPDVVIRLSVPIDTAIRRDAQRVKEDAPDRAAVERRRDMESIAEYSGNVIRLNTDGPFVETLNAFMKAVWARI
jgi:thymidylate kinase